MMAIINISAPLNGEVLVKKILGHFDFALQCDFSELSCRFDLPGAFITGLPTFSQYK